MKKELNIQARDSLVNQITETMQEIDERIESLKIGLQYMDNARAGAYTEDLLEIRTMLGIASRRCEEDFSDMQKKTSNLARVADEINQSEREPDEDQNGNGDSVERGVEILPGIVADETPVPKRKPKKQLRILRS